MEMHIGTNDGAIIEQMQLKCNCLEQYCYNYKKESMKIVSKLKQCCISSLSSTIKRIMENASNSLKVKVMWV